MGILNDLRMRVQQVNDGLMTGDLIRNVVVQHPDDILDESAGRYAAWKLDGINYPYTANRNPDAPNLYINGRFHDELGVQFNADSVGIIGTTGYSKGIIDKYGINTFGLMAANWLAVFVEYGAYDQLMNDLRNILYG